MAEKGADRSSMEIKTLVRNLHPDRGNHKDRLRRLNKFRNYVMNDGKNANPEFYDDDIPLLFLGAAAPAAYLDDDEGAMESTAGMYGLLQACGTPSEEHAGTLKRSARHAMNLLKWLLLDWKEAGQKKGDLNLFCTCFLSLPAQHYHHMQLDLHVIGDDRGGAREDACQIIVLILTQHLAENGESAQPVTLDELMAQPKAQQEFELWSARHTSSSVQEIIKRNAMTREAELALQQRQEALANKALGGIAEDFEAEDSEHSEQHGNRGDEEGEEDETDGFGGDDGDVMAVFRKRQKTLRKELKEAEGRGEITSNRGVALRWEDTQLAREQRARAASAARSGQHSTVRDSQDAAQEAAGREEERAKAVSLDPLAIVDEEGFDLRNIEGSQAEQVEQALHELQESLQKAEGTSEELVKKIMGQKESLEALIERMGGIEAMENPANAKYSILPSNPKFDPILFLTLVHRSTNYEALIESIDRLSGKTENQAEQLQNLVRENFPLFVRCAEGFEEFRQSSENVVGLGLNERIDKLEGIAESCTFQAKKSFKPLLDNTSEVRKVQSAISVLQRVSPILQVPALMRQHIENRRYSQALKTYRRVLVIDGSCKIGLLTHVKRQAEQCVLETRKELEDRLARPDVPEADLLEGIRDLGELLELDVPLPSSPVAEEKVLDDDLEDGSYRIDDTIVKMREYPPALGCMLVQTAHFSQAVRRVIQGTDDTCLRIYAGESMSQSNKSDAAKAILEGHDGDPSKGTSSQWKYDVLDVRVFSTVDSVDTARVWLPRLIRIARAAREDEKRRAARVGLRRLPWSNRAEEKHFTAFEVFVTDVRPTLLQLVEHATFCALGSNPRVGSKEVTVTYGANAPDRLKALLRSPLPPSQSTKVARELVDLVELLVRGAEAAQALKPEDENSSLYQLSPLEECKVLGEAAVTTIEKRRCIYAFDVCARSSLNRASGTGKFDADSLLSCLQNLAEQLSRPEECSNEVEKGCELVVRRSCEGLASYVRDRGESARLGAVAECAEVMGEKIAEIAKEATTLSPKSDSIFEVMMEDIMGLEGVMFDEYLDSIRRSVANSVKIGWLDQEADVLGGDGNANLPPIFPPYLSASLLSIVRCRAQIEQTLGDRVRRTEGLSYQHIALSTAADAVVHGICNEIMTRKLKLRVRQADRLANEIDFLKISLKKFLSEDSIVLLESTLSMVNTKAGRGRDYQADGPDGLAALEELERLGRVYVLCLGGDESLPN